MRPRSLPEIPVISLSWLSRSPSVASFSFEYGRLEPVAPMIRRFRATGTYVVGRGEVAVIDPGPTSPIMSRRCSRPPPHFVIE
jgi:hypothetical protein